MLTTDHGVRFLAERAPHRVARLRRQLHPDELDAAARLIVLSSLDRRWRDHLGYAAAVREGIHLRALVRDEPVHAFNRLIADAFASAIDEALADAALVLERAPVVDGRLDLADAGLYRPGATWTYMVSDDHFGTEFERIGRTVKSDFLALRSRLR
ncbi:MAG: hypothetical protein QM582_12325 [Micropruina sp.]|uniref:hypothetical protein n=1 Tax=Micropruina sp. TaxID=2737536 RepID=UPI0039E484C4